MLPIADESTGYPRSNARATGNLCSPRLVASVLAIVACVGCGLSAKIPSQPQTSLTLTAFTLSGGEQNVIPPGSSAELEFTPDEHMSFLKQGGGTFKLWAAGGGTYGAFLFRTPDLFTLGAPTTVFGPSGAGTTAFDADYAGPGSVFPSASGADLLMIYHAENHLFRGVDYPGEPFFAGIGLARSSDGGVTWQRQGEIIAAYNAQDTAQTSGGAGALTPTAVEADGYIYVIFREIDLQSNVTGFGLARAPIDSDGAPATWQKYYQGSFSTPGLGGRFTPLNIVLDPSQPTDQRQPHLSYNTYLKQYLMAMVGNGGIYVLTSPDLINWTSGIVALAAPTPDASATTADVKNWYPTLISPSEESDATTGQTGYLYYAKFLGDGTSHHYMYRQAFSITAR
jgi:hypothetical protein